MRISRRVNRPRRTSPRSPRLDQSQRWSSPDVVSCARSAGACLSRVYGLALFVALIGRFDCRRRRRELAAKEHIVVHDVGKGQQAFAPNRRDMTAYRAEQERLRREAGAPAAPMPLKAEPVALPPAAAPNPLAALRVAQPLGGGRIVQPRPSNVPRPQPVARPAPRQAARASASVADCSSSEPSSATQEVGEAAAASSNGSNGSAILPASAVEAPASDAGDAGAAAAAAVPPPQPEPPLLPSPACSSYFVEPLSWMSPFLESGVLAGKITCPNKRCGAKLGNFDWAGNRTCSHLRDNPWLGILCSSS